MATSARSTKSISCSIKSLYPYTAGLQFRPNGTQMNTFNQQPKNMRNATLDLLRVIAMKVDYMTRSTALQEFLRWPISF